MYNLSQFHIQFSVGGNSFQSLSKASHLMHKSLQLPSYVDSGNTVAKIDDGNNKYIIFTSCGLQNEIFNVR